MSTSKATRNTRNRTQAEKVYTRTQVEKVYTYLCGVGGRTLTARQASTRFRVKNLRAVISDIRDMGVDVRTDMKKTRNSKGPVAVYSLGLVWV